MTITELIAHLNNIRDAHGDIPVLIDLTHPNGPAYRAGVATVGVVASIGGGPIAAVLQDSTRALPQAVRDVKGG